eukprot:Skav232913  [mRNA]  locus=scaffold1477:617629:619563:+ [translate_table: standard]
MKWTLNAINQIRGINLNTTCDEDPSSLDPTPPLSSAHHLTAAGDEASSAAVLRIANAKVVAGDPIKHKKIGNTASRTLYRVMDSLNLKWNIPISETLFHTDLGLVLKIPYIKPSDALTYLLSHRKEVLLGGYTSMADCANLLQGYWQVFKRYHPSHQVFTSHPDSLPYCLPIFLYGDEGRGRRRGNTAVFMMETPFGVRCAQTKKRNLECSCCPCEPSIKKFCGNDQKAVPVRLNHACFAVHNYKEHSFLTRLVLFCLPCATYKAFPDLIPFLLDLIAKDLRSAFFEGIEIGKRIFTPVCVGLKADVKFHAYVAKFDRWYSRMGRIQDQQCCHERLAGDARWPFEDVNQEPAWRHTIHMQRPWQEEPVLSQLPFDARTPERLYKRDPFHICKMGIFRHVTASILAICILWRYLDDPDSDDGNGIPVLIKRAHGHFRLWASAYKKSPALRSFSKQLMNWPNLVTSPWFNTKGSDCMLLMCWLDVFVGQLLLAPKEPEHVPVMKVMRSVLQSGKASFDLMCSHRLLLHRRCAIQLYEHMTTTLNGYVWLAQWSMRNDIVAFAMVPKVHAWKHEAYDLYKELTKTNGESEMLFFNPLVHSCEINEDTIGRVSRVSRRVDSRLMEKRCLQLFLSKCHFLHKRAFPNLV